MKNARLMQATRLAFGLALALMCFSVSLDCNEQAIQQTCDQETQWEQENPATTGELAAANAANGFAMDLYKQLGQFSGNLFFSPFSITSAFFMLHEGARGNTASQLETVFHMGAHPESVAGGLSALTQTLGDRGGDGKWELALADSFWAQTGRAFLPAFLDSLHSVWNADASLVDFAGAPADAANQINTWVSNATNEKITELVAAGDLSGNTMAVLANAVYFKGTWTYKFPPEDTADAPFYLRDGTTVNVPMMQVKADLRMHIFDSFDLLEMPYACGGLSMLVMLPQTGFAIEDVESQLTADNLAAWRAQLVNSMTTQLYFPRFSQQASLELKTALTAMGLTDVFQSGAADLSGIDGTNQLFVGEVAHAATIDVNEEGTAAAAATAVIELACVGPQLYKADHPFIYLIQDNRTGAILFLGRMDNPLS